jgi:hypothetical protein
LALQSRRCNRRAAIEKSAAVISYFARFASSTSHFSITGAFASNVPAFAIKPAATPHSTGLPACFVLKHIKDPKHPTAPFLWQTIFTLP